MRPTAMHILVLSHYFPPEVNAAANRIFELSRHWVEAGNKVTVVTCNPNHPRGMLYPGHRNSLIRREQLAGIDVIRVWTFLAANEGFLLRILNYMSYFISVNVLSFAFPKPDVVVSTSPQFFCGLAGYTLGLLKRSPWVLEIRDLWPESIIAVGAMKPSLATRMLQAIERFAYRHARLVVSVSDAFIPHLQTNGARPENIHVITNGVDTEFFHSTSGRDAFRSAHGLADKFVVGYVGTHGMAHGLETILKAAERLRTRSDIAFLLVGDGAERKHLLVMRDEMSLTNVVMLDQVARDLIPTVWASIDAAVVPLRDTVAFRSVIPSKMLEAFAAGKPVLLGVRGIAKQILIEGDCGIAIPPEDAQALSREIERLADDRTLAARLGANGLSFASIRFNRERLATDYLGLLKAIVR
jgi:colanic acid biosynthesis glycosyl transferase WcaI